ncbi:MAG: hypothetical protein IJO63_02460 [Bacilli bacterium]|nr:hypothetical protein [Bacilli bacterium]
MEEIKKESNGRGNVILLTVIAIVTMIIVVIGATFAYLASSVQDSDTSNINAATNAGSDLLMMNAGDDVEIVANLENFYEGAGNLTGMVGASVQLSTSSTEEVTYDYRVYLTIPHNDFEYSSGTCYTKNVDANVVADSYDACMENSESNVWATLDGIGYACYGPSEKVANEYYSNELTCLSSSANMWAPANTAELVFDLYQSVDGVTDADACLTAGVCVSNTREVIPGLTNQTACVPDESSTNTWLANIYDSSEGICYEVVKTADLTELTTTDEKGYSLIDNASISATNGTARHYYRGIVTLINFGHNQIVNGNKTFNGVLNFERIVEEEPVTP